VCLLHFIGTMLALLQGGMWLAGMAQWGNTRTAILHMTPGLVWVLAALR
jgi:hypothetical protein